MGSVPHLVERGKNDRRMGEPREVGWEIFERFGPAPLATAPRFM